MRLQAVALAAGMLAGAAHANDDAASPAQLPVKKPSFTPTSVTGEFVEQFTDDWQTRWKPSHAKKESAEAAEEWAYIGQWSVEEPTVYPGIDGDKGLVVKNAAAHHAISAKFGQKIDTTGKPLVVQYEVKLQDGLECGGAYLKLLRENDALHQDEFSNATPYVIMFGPDKCGHTNKVHFIFNHKNPKTGKYEEKHLSSPPSAKIVKTTELYTLIVNPDNTFSIKQDGVEVKSGSLLEDFTPAVNPPKEIDDASDSMPEDWVDEARIPDPEASKPEDWDEDAPVEIVDEEATIPDDWLVDEPTMIPDPQAEKPEDWEDDEDGDWIPPTVPNPKCAQVSGCGPWSKPVIKNPAYKGKWSAPQIDNPAYKGVWAPRKIANPDYFEDETPANFEPIGAVGFEIWTMQKDILFDNIYIGHSVEDAEKLAKETFDIKHPIETAQADASKPKDKPTTKSNLKFLDDPTAYVQEKLELFLALAQNDPIQALKAVPEAGAGIAAAVLTVLAILGGVVSMLSSTPEVKKPASETKDKADAKDKAQASSTGAQATKSEATKRAGKSQS